MATVSYTHLDVYKRQDFDMLVVPGADHGAPSRITQRKTHDFFLRNLLHEEPTDDTVSSAGNGSN